MSVEEFRKTMVKQYYGPAQYEEYKLKDDDLNRIHEISKERFDNWGMIYGKKPKFNMVRTGMFEGNVQVIVGENCYEVTKPAAKAIMRVTHQSSLQSTI